VYCLSYVPFYGGFIEISGIPLAVVDIFHPTHFKDVADSSPCLDAVNGAARIAFVILFLLIRVLLFPAVTLLLVVPDMVAELREGSPLLAPCVVLVLSLSLMFLQLFWATKVLKQCRKALFPPPEKVHGEEGAEVFYTRMLSEAS